MISTHRVGSLGTCFYPSHTPLISGWVQLGGRGSDLHPLGGVPWDLLLLFISQTTTILGWVQLGGRSSDLHPPGGIPWDLILPFSHTDYYNFRVGSAWRPGQ